MKKLFLSFLSLAFTITSYSQLPELIYYQFENSPGVINYASAPVGLNPATITGQTVGTGGFLGSNGLIGLGTPSANNNVNTGWNTRINGSFTLAFWVNNSGPGTTLYYIFGDGGASNFRCFTNGVAGANNWMLRGAGLPDLLVSGGASSGGKMIHAVYDASSGTYTSYIDGLQNTQVTVPTTPNQTGTGLTIGGYNNSSGLSGMIDEFRWYNRALTQTEITATYNIDLNFSGNCTNAFTNLNVNNILATTAQVNWTPGSGNSSFWLEYGLAGFTPGNGTMISGTYPGTQPPVNLTGLAVNTNYDYYIGEICNSGADSIYSASPYQFSTTRLCAPPTNLAVSNVLTTSADITWNHAGGANSFTIFYGAGLSQTATSSPFTLTGLSPASTYDVYVQADCGNTNGVSDSLGPINLTTACGIAVAPYFNNFDLGVPNCWTQSTTDDFDWTLNANGTTSGTTGPSDDITGGGNYMYIETSSPRVQGDSAILNTVSIDISNLINPQLRFYSHMYGATTSELSVWITDASGVTNQVFIKNGDQGDQWNEELVMLSNYSGVVQFTILGIRGSSFTGDLAIDNFEVREGPTCPRPPASSFGVSNLLATSADLNWLAGGNELFWGVEWGPAGFTLGSGNFNTTNLFFAYPISGLTATTTYEFYIKAICAPGDTSVWSGPFTFTTPCGALIPPQLEDFSRPFPPNVCWDQAGNGNPSIGPSGIGNSLWNSDGFGNVGTTGAVRCNLNITGDNEWILTPQYDFSSGGPFQVEFDFGVFTQNSSNPGILGSDDRVEVLISRDGGGSWSVLKNFNNNYTTNPNGNHEIIGLPNDSTVVQFAFWASEGTVNDPVSNDVMFDNFEIIPMPACPEPTSLIASSITANNAIISWTPGGNETSWYIEWGVSGFVQGTGTNDSVTTNSYSLTGLSSSTTYDVYIQSFCSTNNLSFWAGPLSFSTPIQGPVGVNCTSGGNPDIIYSDDLETSNGWTGSFGTGTTAGSWNVRTGPTGSTGTGPSGAHSGNNYFYYETSGVNPSNNSITSPLIDLSGALDDAELSFWIHAYGATMGTLNIGVGNTSTGPFTTIFTNTGQIQTGNNDPYQNVGINLSSYLGQQIYLQIDYTSGTSFTGDIAIDLIEVSSCISCPSPTALSASNITANSADLSWVAGGTETAWDIQYGNSGFAPGSGTTVGVTTNPYFLTGLSSSTAYDYYIKAICAPGDSSSWTGPFTFSTISNPTCDYTINMIDSFGDGWNGASIDVSINGAFVASFSNTNTTAANAIQTAIFSAFTGDSVSFSFTSGSWDSEITFEILDPTLNSLTLGYISAPNPGFFLADSSSTSACQPPSCPQPSSLNTTNVTGTSADLSWTAGGTETAWDIQYGSSGFTLGNGTTVGVSSNPYILTGLSASTTYDYYLKAICAPGDSSSWAGPFTFGTTIQSPLGVNCISGGIPGLIFSDDLEITGGWTGLGTGNSTWTIGTGGTSSFNTGPSSSHTGTSYFYFETSGSNWPMSGAIVSPIIDLSNANDDAELSFWIHAFGATMGNLNLGIGNSATGPFTNVFSNSGQLQTGSNDPYQNVGVNLANYIGQQIYLQFDYTSGSSYTGDIAIDLIEISSCISCPSPSSLSTSNITGNSANISWTAGGTETAWNIQYGAFGFAPGSGTTVGVTTNPYSLTGLNPSTTYDYYIKAICAPGDSSSWAGPYTFTTPCAALIPPQLEDFTLGFTPNTCWDQADDGSPLTGPNNFGTSSWTTDGFGNIGTTGAVKVNLFTTGINDWILTPQYDLSTGGPYQIEFDFGVFQYTTNNNGSLPKTLGPDDVVEVLISRDNGSSWNVLKGYDSSYVTAAGGNHETITLTNDTGIVQFAIWASEGTQASTIEDVDVMIDNFEIVIIPCQQPTALGASNMTASSADLSWTAGGNEIAWDIQYGSIGFSLGNGTVDSVNSNPYSLIGLSGSSTYDYYVKAICAPGDSSSWAGPFTFTTLISCPEPNGLNASNITASSVDISWTAGGTETAWDLQYGNSGFVLGNGTIDSVSSNPYSLTGISPSTSYDVYIKGICSPGDSSSWAGPFTFVTSCAPGTFQSISSCNTYLWNNTSYDSSGVYIDTLQASNGCDSIVTLNLTINNPVIIQDVEVSCDSVFIWNGNPLYSSGIYLDTLQAVNTCDSVVKLSLTLNYTSSSLTTQIICEGDSIKFGSSTYSIAGLYSDTLQSGIGCDSISTLDLIVTDLIVSIDTSQLNLIANISGGMGPFNYFWSNGSTSSSITPISNGLYSLFINDANGCISNTATYNFIFNTTAVINNVKDILNIYPNPNKGQFIITNSEPINEIFITDLQGKSVYTNENLNVNSLDIKLHNLEKGMYLVNIFTKNGMNIKTVVIH